jgi:hypothetical protein
MNRPAMPSVNRQYVREEFEQIKVRFRNLSNKGKISPEITALFQSMVMMFELLIAVFMEKKTRKDNRNSSIPSSQTEKDRTFSGAHGKGKKHNGELSENIRTVETIQVAEVKNCQFCGESLDLDEIPATGHERRTKVDIIFEKVVSHVDAEIKVCPQCKMENKWENGDH